jgi:hypothetical protein
MRKFDGLSYRDLRWRLHRQGLPDAMVEKTVESVQEFRRARADIKRQKLVHGKAWKELIAALQHERRIVRSMVRYKTTTPAPERDDFINSYFAALDRLYAKLTLKQRQGGMPEHSHWTDYVPERIKDAFAEAAAGIPPRHKAKVKEPFQRTSPLDLHNLRHARLLRRTTNERATVLLRLQANPDDAQAKRKIGVLDTALTRIKEMADDAHVPDHWRDLVPEMLGDPEVLTDEPKQPRKQRTQSGNMPAEMILYMNQKKKTA